MNRAPGRRDPVVEDERLLVGIFTERDLLTRVVVAGSRSPHETTGRGRHDPRGRAPRSSTIPSMQCLALMRSTGCRHLPVVHGGRAIAMLSMRDLLRDEVEDAHRGAGAVAAQRDEQLRRPRSSSADRR